MPHPIVHVEFQVKDVKKAMRWYAELFGWETTYDADTNYGMFSYGASGEIGGGFNLMTEHPVGTIAYIQTDNIPALLTKAQEMGAKLIQQATTVPGKGTYAIIADPDGNAIGLWDRGAF